MGRPKKEEYWNQVTKLGNNAWKCKHCGRKFKGGASRIKAHVERIEREGIQVCKGSINCVPREAVNAMNPVEMAEGGHEMVDANIRGSMDNQSNTESVNLLGGLAPVHVTRSDDVDFRSEIDHLNELLHDLNHEECNIKGQLECLESRGKKRKRQVDKWLNKVEDLKNKVVHMNNSVDQHGLTELCRLDMPQLIEEVRKHKEQKPLVLSNELVGESFERNVKKMWELLGDDQVFIIAIHGMGGVGKTCLVTHMETEIKRKGAFSHVFWVTVSHGCCISKLQQEIAERVGVKLEHGDERTRAANLSLTLETKEKSVLILDDVWEIIDLQKVGIPLKVNGLKLILTSRLEHVCQQMDCLPNNIIRMHPLSYNEGLELFLLKLGYRGAPAILPPKVIEIAESIVRECNGLPLGISVMARTMKGVNDIHRWRHASGTLKNLAKGKVMEEVFKVLKLSYDNLTEKDVQSCFLHCASYYRIERADLIMKLVEDGILNGTRSLKETFDEGRTMLDELKEHSLLLDSNDLRMHGLVRKMACHILKESHRYLVECNKGLIDISHMKEWTANLEVVSLMKNNIKEIPAGTSPYCPRLSSLILSYNLISHIPECFFANMNALAILDLSCNDRLTSLPDSLSNLRSLISLVLTKCSELKHVPPLGSLQALSRLDISRTSIEVVQDLEMLINLRWLDLSYNEDLRLLPGSILPNLINLQYLDLRYAGSMKVKVEDVRGMTMPECFGGSFHDCESYNNYVQKFQNRGYVPKTYLLHSGTDNTRSWLLVYDVPIVPEDDECRIVVFGDCEESLHWLPSDLEKLYIFDNFQWTGLCGALSSNGPSSVRSIEICMCTKVKSLFCSSGKCSLCSNLKTLQSLRLSELGSLTVICKEDVANRTLALSPNGVFSHLRHFLIARCDNIETLLTPGSLSQLQNLETMTVMQCDSMTEIFAANSGDGDDGGSSITLPKLTKVELISLPRLKTVCKGIIVCESLPVLVIERCPNLERVPVIQVFSLVCFF